MKHISIFLLLTLVSTQLWAQENLYMREMDKKTNTVCLRGTITFNDIMKESSFKWFQQNASAYKPNTTVLAALKPLLPKYDFIVLCGTWCDDTRMYLPQFYRIIQETTNDFWAVKMYAVNREKEALNGEQTLYKLEKIPTIIVLKNQREIGRITESPSKSIEEDLLSIIEKNREEQAKNK